MKMLRLVVSLCALASCGKAEPLPEGANPGECSDGADNDGDGAFDCADTDCAGAPACEESDTDTDTDSDTDADTDADTDTDTDTDSDTDTDTDTAFPAHECFDVPSTSCPPDTPFAGSAGGFGLQYASLSWAYSSRCELSYAAPVYLRRPADLESLAVTVDARDRWTGIGFLAVDDRVVLDLEAPSGPTAWWTAPFKHDAVPTSTVVLPNSPATDVPPGDCVAVVPVAAGDARGEESYVWLSSRRESRGRGIELNFVVAGDTDITGDEISEVLYYTEEYFSSAGLGPVDAYLYYVDTTWGDYLPDAEGPEVDALRSVELTDAGYPSVNVFFVQDIGSGGLYGFAAGVPGPIAVPETSGSGVIVSVDTHLLGDFVTLDTDEMGATITHELGHQLGLFHTTEADGSDHDVLSDTPECPLSRDSDRDGTLTASECDGYGGRHVMFWTSAPFTQTTWSSQQQSVLTRSPAVRP